MADTNGAAGVFIDVRYNERRKVKRHEHSDVCLRYCMLADARARKQARTPARRRTVRAVDILVVEIEMLMNEENDRIRLAFIYDQLDDIQQIFPDKDFIAQR